MKNLIIIILTLASIRHVQSQTLSGNKEDIQIILKNTEDFSKYVMASDYTNIANSYTNGAKIFPNNTNILEGEDIIKYWTLPEGISTTYHKITQSEINIINDMAYDYGYYEGKTKHKDGRISSWKGKYVIVWKKVDDDWKMHLDIWNNTK
ncbi:ketosteroid isomerase-like protein [Tenacibaculum adriaticum]|uniref:Ketosteroid isomerase-like protein n=1 Tax=Tenacibaculum adriaticum TaxID=413713 RepID=A0A5S5DWU4_9FLAO|nr:nuclear transport factor 2 family protein [Tenacibaculum adriaticum]TYP99536.1 ketosteroid isomerase-like protein [Tenacibaculum adriaticum]